MDQRSKGKRKTIKFVEDKIEINLHDFGFVMDSFM